MEHHQVSIPTIESTANGRAHAWTAWAAVVADQGMCAETDAAGRLRIIHRQDGLDRQPGASRAPVILPISDGYVVHLGVFGSIASCCLPEDADCAALRGKLAPNHCG